MKRFGLNRRAFMAGAAVGALILIAGLVGYLVAGGGNTGDRVELRPMALEGATTLPASNASPGASVASQPTAPSAGGAALGARPASPAVSTSAPGVTAKTPATTPATTLVATTGANVVVVQSTGGVAVGSPITAHAPPNGVIAKKQYQIGPYFRKTQKPGDSGTVVAECPAGTKVVGGGFAVSGQPDVRVYRSRMSGNGWSVAAANYTATTVAIEIDAICLEVSGSVIAVPFNEDLPPGQQRSPASQCPAGTVLLGGGYTFSLYISPYASKAAPDNTWVVDATYSADSGNTGAGDVTVEAYCYNGAAARATTLNSGGDTFLPAGQASGTYVLTCPTGQVATGGGGSFVMSVPAGGSFSAKASIIVSSPEIGKWFARLQNGSTNSVDFLGANVQCVSF